MAADNWRVYLELASPLPHQTASAKPLPRIIDVVPSEPLGGFLTGTLRFSAGYARRLIELGERDMKRVINRLLAEDDPDDGYYRDIIDDASRALSRDPQNREAYWLRAHAFFDLQERERALADFRKLCEIDRDLTDARLRIYALQSWLGEAGAATAELSVYVNEAGVPRNGLTSVSIRILWDAERKLIAFLLGEMAEAEILQDSAVPRVSAHFYAGMKRLASGDAAGARDHFALAVRMGQLGNHEHRSAAALHKRLSSSN